MTCGSVQSNIERLNYDDVLIEASISPSSEIVEATRTKALKAKFCGLYYSQGDLLALFHYVNRAASPNLITEMVDNTLSKVFVSSSGASLAAHHIVFSMFGHLTETVSQTASKPVLRIDQETLQTIYQDAFASVHCQSNKSLLESNPLDVSSLQLKDPAYPRVDVSSATQDESILHIYDKIDTSIRSIHACLGAPYANLGEGALDQTYFSECQASVVLFNSGTPSEINVNCRGFSPRETRNQTALYLSLIHI